MIDVTDCLFEFLQNNSSLDNSFNFSNSLVFVPNLDYLLILLHDLFNTFHDNRNLNNLLDNVLDVLIHINKLRNDLLNLNNSRHFNYSLFNSFYFIDLWDCYCSFNYLFDNLIGSHNFLNCCLNWHNLFSQDLDLFYLISDIRNFLDYFFYSSIHNYSFFNSDKLYRLRLNCILDNNLFNNCRNLNNLFNSFSHRN